jgi:hypothetical protein
MAAAHERTPVHEAAPAAQAATGGLPDLRGQAAIVTRAAGAADARSGRIVSVHDDLDDLDDLVARAEQLVRDDLLVPSVRR